MIKKLAACFTPDKINTGQQIELDIAKGFAIIFMVLCHAYTYLSDWSDPLLELILYDILGGPFAAPIFMFCMGITIHYSRKKQPKDNFLRGCQLLLIGAALEILRNGIPLLIYNTLTTTPTQLQHIFDIIMVDILQFAGLFFIIFSLIQRFTEKPVWFAAAALVFSLAGQVLNRAASGNTFLDIVLGFIWRTRSKSFFPLLNWFIFPTAGYLFGDCLMRCHDRNTFYQTLFPITALISAAYLIYFVFCQRYTDDLYYGIGTIDALLVINLVFTVICFCYLCVTKLSALANWLAWMSKYLNFIYCAHWIIIMYPYTMMEVFTPDSYFSGWVIVPIGLLVLAVSCLAAAVYENLRKSIIHR